MPLILVAQVAGAFGVRGEVRLTAYTADPMSLIAYSPLLDEMGAPALTLTSGRIAKGALIVNAREAATREAAAALRGLRLYVDRSALPAPGDDEYYLTDLIGLVANSPAGVPLGRVKSVADFGAGDLLEIEPADGGPSWWSPFTQEAVPEVNVAEGWLMLIEPADS